MTERRGLSYDVVGDNYNQKDPLKVYAQRIAATTAENLVQHGYREVAASRGQSAYVIYKDMGGFYLAGTPEGLGTKNLIADAVYKLNPNKTNYYEVGIDTVAAIVNDLITSGAQTLFVLPHWGIGSNDWLNDQRRFKDLVDGWREGCHRAEAAYGGGETPTLRGIIYPDKVELSGSAMGIIEPKERLVLEDKLRSGDHMVFVASNGLHANGASIARHIAEDILTEGYNTPLPSGKTFGEALLSPSHIYAKLQRKLFVAGIDIHYMINMTGHGLKKIMRADQEFTYRVTQLLKPQEEFELIKDAGRYTAREMYEIFNMGIGFVFYVPRRDVAITLDLAAKAGFQACDGGVVEEGEKKVIIEELGIEFEKEELKLS